MSEHELANAAPTVVDRTEPLWFLGTLARVLLDGEQTGGRFAIFEPRRHCIPTRRTRRFTSSTAR
jgi:hypothetical protein